MIPSIPTTYRGVRFRSRLEAKWAAFFDLSGWRWDYEPLDLGGYIPDFVLSLRRSVLVEVKPIMWAAKEEFPLGQALLAGEKIAASGWEHEALVVGASLDYSEEGTHFERPGLGLMREHCSDMDGDLEWLWERAPAFWCGKCGAKSFRHSHGSWRCRVAGCYDGDRYLGDWDVEATWREAANVVQWRAP